MLSGLQVGLLSVSPEQQFSVALHWVFAVRQMAPFGLQRVGLLHNPMGSVPLLTQTAAPQQSSSLAHRSAVGRQPLARWQT